jgi:type I restriction enzyme S subunit
MSNKSKVKGMQQNHDRALTPKLRFPEFQDGPGWEVRKLGDIAEFVNERISPTRLCLENYISTENMLSHFGGVTAASKLPSIGSVTRFQVNDVLVSNIRPYLKKVWHATMEGGTSNDVVVLRAKRALIAEYFAHVVKSDLFIEHVMKGAKGLKMPRGDIGLMREYLIPYPSPSEQRKIGHCLSSLDEVIAAQARKVEALKAHKKGLTQHLFPRANEIVPHFRFPGFRQAKSWQKAKISDLLSKALKPVTVEADRIYREIGIRSHGKGVFHKDLVSGKQIGNKRVFWVVKDAFIVNIVFAWEQAVATTSDAEEGMIASHRFPMYVAKLGRCDVRFLKHFFLTVRGKRLLGLASPGGAGRNRTLGQKEFEKLEILLPQDVTEQVRIVECLSSIDDLIDVHIRQLEALKTHKKGLIQQLFPSTDEVKA